MPVDVINIGLDPVNYRFKQNGRENTWSHGILKPGEVLELLLGNAILSDLSDNHDSVVSCDYTGLLNMLWVGVEELNTNGNVNGLVYIGY